MSETAPENTETTSPAPVTDTENVQSPPSEQDQFFSRLSGFIDDRLHAVETRLRSELVHSTSTPEPEPEPEDGPKEDGAYCNQCPEKSSDPLAESSPGNQGETEPEANATLWALNHNAVNGHHVEVWQDGRPYQVAPRAS